MIEFVNAKINIGLQIVRRREDGYHDLQTVFYPVGRYAGLPDNPEPFCDILEIIPAKEPGIRFHFKGRMIDCPDEKNLVCKAARLFFESSASDSGSLGASASASARGERGLEIILEKHLPDGAGMGGGSADASFTLRMLNELTSQGYLTGPGYLTERGYLARQGASAGQGYSDEELAEMALRLGADCPFFIYNRPMYGCGVGEKLTDVKLDLAGYWLVVVKPDVYVSTRDAFAGVTPRPGNIDLRTIAEIPITDWQDVVVNDFETSIFPKFPELARIKERLIRNGAVYASMTGSGSSIYGIYDDYEKAMVSREDFRGETTIEGTYLLKL